MSNLKAVPEPKDPWETGELGKDDKYVACAPPEMKQEIESALDMQMISIRLPKDLVSELKLIAEYRGIGYQPLMRDVLGRFARSEVRQIASELQKSEKQRLLIEEDLVKALNPPCND